MKKNAIYLIFRIKVLTHAHWLLTCAKVLKTKNSSSWIYHVMDSLLQLSQKEKNRMNKMNLYFGKVRRWVNRNKLSLTIVLHQFMMEKKQKNAKLCTKI